MKGWTKGSRPTREGETKRARDSLENDGGESNSDVLVESVVTWSIDDTSQKLQEEASEGEGDEVESQRRVLVFLSLDIDPSFIPRSSHQQNERGIKLTCSHPGSASKACFPFLVENKLARALNASMVLVSLSFVASHGLFHSAAARMT